MSPTRFTFLLATVLFGSCSSTVLAQPSTVAAAAGTGNAPALTAILPNGRQIRPAGTWTTLASYPFAIAVKPDGSEATIPSIGFPFALNVVAHPDGAAPTVKRLPGFDARDNDPSVQVHAGVAYSPDGKVLYDATGDSGKIDLYSTDDWHKLATIDLDGMIGGQTYSRSFAHTVLLSADGHTLYVLDQANFRIVVIDVTDPAAGKLIASIPTGNYPFGEALSPDNNRLYVTNIGLFEYSAIPGGRREDELGTGLLFAPFGYPSKEAREGTEAPSHSTEGKKARKRKIAGLGSENSSRGSSLWTYDVHDPAHPLKTAELRLGEPITEGRDGTVGGAAPTGVVADAGAVYVSLAHQDSIAKISQDGTKVISETSLTPFKGSKFEDARGRSLRGVMPSGLAVRDGKLYVAESGIDSVAVIDADAMEVVEHIPAGWNPSAVTLSPDGKTLYVVNTKGKGAGPNGGPNDGAKGDPNYSSYVGVLEHGSLSAIKLAELPPAGQLTQAVVENNAFDMTQRRAMPKLKHCFLIIRENRTYDEILGDVQGTNGDASLARWGMDGWAEEKTKASAEHMAQSRSASPQKPSENELEATHLHVTPNLHALAKQFAISDNFYVDSDVSVDGHRWVVGINPTEFLNTAWTSGYGGRRSGDPGASQPGRRAMFGGSDSPMPEDEPQFGSIWEHIADSGLGILNYGEGIEIEGGDELDGSEPEGQRLFLNSPVPKPIFEHSDRNFPTFNLGIPDQFRFEEFKRDFTKRVARHEVPGLIVIRLPNDHTADPRPKDGYPYRASYVADNDLALGKIVAFLSRTSIWEDSAIFVTEDDAQGGVDHVDAHRSILLVASPWVIPGAVSHQHSSMGSITRTINELLGMGSLNLEDALSGGISEIFGSKPEVTTFSYLPSDPRVFDEKKARLAKPKTKQEAAQLKDMDDPARIQSELEKSTLKRPARNAD